MKFIITVDTEADRGKRLSKITIQNIKYISRFQECCRYYGFKPTYLCSYEVLDSFVDVIGPFLKSGEVECGAHLHPWTCPPLRNVTSNDFYYHPYPHELPLDLFKEKMTNLTQKIEKVFAVRPKSYRAGRWGLVASHIKTLLELGYIVDCSVTPYISWKKVMGSPSGTGGPDYRNAPIFPYYLDFNDVCKSGGSNLLEVPVTILFTKFAFFKKILKKLGFGAQWLRPYPHMSSKDLINVYKTAKKAGLPYVQLMLHSNELMPGGSPYNPDKKSVEDLYLRLETLFEYLKSDEVQGETLSNFCDYFRTLYLKRV